MADEWRRYLEQQIELGGAEVIMDGRTGGRPDGRAAGRPEEAMGKSSRPAETDDARRRRSGAASEPAGRPTGPAVSPSGRRAAWRKGAPPIPGPGLRVDPPAAELIGDRLAGLDTLDAVADRIRKTFCCQTLCPNRVNAVPGEGNPRARLVLVGEAPGATEDATGRPFVGQAGQLLDKMLEAIELRREDVYITNIVKCRPPQNRKPLPDEIASCMPYLHRQLAIIRPKVIVALGGTAGEALLATRKSLGDLRGKVHSYGGIPVVVTYHPAALLRNPNWKKPTWDDVRIARQLLDR
ncbi:MAG TPA: uracil-DNA glycosylase [Gemmatimonadales bacterium]|nr:uracil-DNA glycosylase [Gemmatimonadales bacterium]